MHRRHRGIVRSQMHSVIRHLDNLLARHIKMATATDVMFQAATFTAMTNARNTLSFELTKTGPYLPFQDPP